MFNFNTRPGLVTLLGILCFITGGYFVISAFIIGKVFGVFSIFIIGLGILYFIVGRGFMKGAPWSRVVYVISYVLGLLSRFNRGSVGSIVIFGLIGGLVVIYLYSKNCKDFFRGG